MKSTGMPKTAGPSALGCMGLLRGLRGILAADMLRSMPVITCIEDLRRAAQRRVPRMFYDYADAGSWTESTYRANEEDLRAIKFRQRVAVNMEGRSVATKMIGIDRSEERRVGRESRAETSARP